MVYDSHYELKALLRNDPVAFTERCFYELNPQGDLMMSPYIELIMARLEACRRGEIKRLIINLPPRYLKSHCASVAFVAWILGHSPEKQIICASYGQELADKHARDCRNIMSSKWYKELFENTRLSDKQAINEFTTGQKGFRLSTSVGGVLTGRGADIIILDDPLKPDDALSQSHRKNVNEWFDNSLLSRLNSKQDGCIIIIMQRLHQDDLVGHVLGQEPWEVLSLPAIATEDQEFIIPSLVGDFIYRRKAGDPLHAEREPIDVIERLRRSMGEYNFLSQYQQTPQPPGGAMVKMAWLKYYDPNTDKPGKFDHIIQSWDTANKAGELNDYSVCTTWGIKGDYFYLLNVFRRRMEFPDLKRAVIDQASIYKPETVLIEDKASGTQLIQELISTGLQQVKAFPPPPGTDKIMRLNVQTSTIENGFMLLPKEASWLADYVQELTSFPGSKHDDQVDSTTQALAWIKAERNFPGRGLLDWMKEQADIARGLRAPDSQSDLTQVPAPKITRSGDGSVIKE